ncbi:hypothetical protein H8959_022651 [Pygathrix nigripes]
MEETRSATSGHFWKREPTLRIVVKTATCAQPLKQQIHTQELIPRRGSSQYPAGLPAENSGRLDPLLIDVLPSNGNKPTPLEELSRGPMTLQFSAPHYKGASPGDWLLDTRLEGYLEVERTVCLPPTAVSERNPISLDLNEEEAAAAAAAEALGWGKLAAEAQPRRQRTPSCQPIFRTPPAGTADAPRAAEGRPGGGAEERGPAH